jgi:UDP-2,3-diacylglucosamine pyrophosphatase LpxH
MKKRWVVCGLIIMIVSLLGCKQLARTEQAVPGSEALWSVQSEVRNKVVVVSDLHFGIDDRYSETIENRKVFITFLERLGAMSDVSELVLAGDFLDDWYLPLTYPAYTDSDAFYRQVIQTNQHVFDGLQALLDKGIRVTYVPGNHDMLLESAVLQEALPGINQARDARGLGAYVTGLRDEIVIEHGHRYDVFSAPEHIANKDLTVGADSMLPPGYFYARFAASWVLQGKPLIKKDYPTITQVPDPKSNPDQFGAYLYYRIWNSELGNRITPFERFEDKVLEMQHNGYNGNYSIADFYPVVQRDGTISAPTLFRNFQRTWDKNQEINLVEHKTSFIESVAGTLDGDYFFKQAKKQYLLNPEKKVDVVVFGHTHRPGLEKLPDYDGKYYVNSGTWIDHNTYHPGASTFVVITSSETVDTAQLYEYYQDGTVALLK